MIESVDFAPRQLSPVDQGRFILRRLYPRARDPVRYAVVRSLLGVGYFGIVGAFLAVIGATPLHPALMTVIGMGVALIPPLQQWRTVRASLRTVGEWEVWAVDLDAIGVTVRTADRTALVLWRAAKGVLVTPREVVIQFRIRDVVSVPTPVFRDTSHRDRFIAFARAQIPAQT